jgi:hypothetical protein
MKKQKPEKKRGTATNSAPSRQVIPRERKSLTVINHITFQFVCEMGKKRIQPPQMPADDIDDEWENWAAMHPKSAL